MSVMRDLKDEFLVLIIGMLIGISLTVIGMTNEAVLIITGTVVFFGLGVGIKFMMETNVNKNPYFLKGGKEIIYYDVAYHIKTPDGKLPTIMEVKNEKYGHDGIYLKYTKFLHPSPTSYEERVGMNPRVHYILHGKQQATPMLIHDNITDDEISRIYPGLNLEAYNSLSDDVIEVERNNHKKSIAQTGVPDGSMGIQGIVLSIMIGIGFVGFIILTYYGNQNYGESGKSVV